VHGTPLATPLLDLLGRELPGASMRRYEFKELRPSFRQIALALCAPENESKSVPLWTEDHEEYVCMKDEASLK
jgi:3-methylfumaryl-CoA hydratase